MKKIFFMASVILLFLLTMFLFTNIKSETTQEGNSSQEDYVPNEVLVKFKSDVSKYVIQEAVHYLQGKIINYLGNELSPFAWDSADFSLRSFRLDPYLLHIRVPETIGTNQAIDILNQSPYVEYAEKNGIYHACKVPNDQFCNNPTNFQYGLGRIKAYDAWDITTGRTDIVVAVIDSGIDMIHEDLKDYDQYQDKFRIWKNEDEIPGNGIDDDNNGYKDDYRGWNFVSNNNNIADDDEFTSHGTHNAGIIGAWTNNGIGIAGVDWKAKIMVLKGLDNNTNIKASSVINAIDYATENGAHISNNSYAKANEQQYSTGAAIARAMNAGRLFIAAAGNKRQLDWRDNDIKPVYPASHDIDNVISVAYTSCFIDELNSNSHYGFYSVDLAAPGEQIYSTWKNNNYDYLDGTSEAAPFVAGVAALIWANRPNLSWWQVKTIIMKSVDQLSSLSGKVQSGGRLNAYKALTIPTPNLPTAPSNLNAQAFGCDVKLTWTDNSNNENGFEIYRKNGDIFVMIDTTGPNMTAYWDIDLIPYETWCYYVRAYNQDGNSPKSLSKCAKTGPCQ